MFIKSDNQVHKITSHSLTASNKDKCASFKSTFRNRKYIVRVITARWLNACRQIMMRTHIIIITMIHTMGQTIKRLFRMMTASLSEWLWSNVAHFCRSTPSTQSFFFKWSNQTLFFKFVFFSQWNKEGSRETNFVRTLVFCNFSTCDLFL